jgi:hypothetical protein
MENIPLLICKMHRDLSMCCCRTRDIFSRLCRMRIYRKRQRNERLAWIKIKTINGFLFSTHTVENKREQETQWKRIVLFFCFFLFGRQMWFRCKNNRQEGLNRLKSFCARKKKISTAVCENLCGYP